MRSDWIAQVIICLIELRNGIAGKKGIIQTMKLMRSFVVVATAAAIQFVASLAHAQPVTLRISSTLGADHTSSKAMQIFKAELAQRSNSAIDVDLSFNMQLGGAKELIDNVRAGSMFATWVGVAYVSRLVPEVEAVSLPFVFRDADHAMRAIDGAVGKLIEAKLRAKGFTALAWMDLGARQVTNSKRPLKSLDDFKDLKLRVQPNETHLAVFRALGAKPVAMDIKDVYAALQQEDIDGQENPYSITDLNKYFESQKYLSNSGHVLDFIILVANNKIFTGLPPEQQKAIRAAARVAAIQQRKMAAAAEVAALADLKAKGMQFDPLPPETRVALRTATASVIDSMRKRVGAELVDQVVAQGHARSGAD
jgi:tripartite ATP-independent transporter DctP family solute receptor